ncbi:MAG: hypothetical protein Q8M12_06540, partial [bacterium]|nr:hypothetical protein [bacterium]
MWNPFNKKKKNPITGEVEIEESAPKMGMLQSLAMKRLAKMSPQERNKMMQEALKPENRGKIMDMMNAMKASGQVNDAQIEQAKKMLG